MAKITKLTRYQITVARVIEAIEAGRVLTGDDVLSRCRRTVGPYQEAVDRGIRFAVLVEAPRLLPSPPEHRLALALGAAEHFVDAVGTTRANEAVHAAARRAA
jgi:hypothetical protein